MSLRLQGNVRKALSIWRPTVGVNASLPAADGVVFTHWPIIYVTLVGIGASAKYSSAVYKYAINVSGNNDERTRDFAI